MHSILAMPQEWRSRIEHICFYYDPLHKPSDARQLAHSMRSFVAALDLPHVRRIGIVLVTRTMQFTHSPGLPRITAAPNAEAHRRALAERALLARSLIDNMEDGSGGVIQFRRTLTSNLIDRVSGGPRKSSWQVDGRARYERSFAGLLRMLEWTSCWREDSVMALDFAKRRVPLT